MSRSFRIEYPGALYHVTNRGNERKPIFKDDTDRQEFLEILTRSLAIYLVKLYRFVLKLLALYAKAEEDLSRIKI